MLKNNKNDFYFIRRQISLFEIKKNYFLLL